MTRSTLIALLPFVAACTETPPVAEPVWSGEAVETALIWGGFDHEWGYNHRLNRLGNWVGPLDCNLKGCSAEMAHSAASGLGSDTATWSARGTAITAPGVGFLAGSTAFEIDAPAAEGKLVREQTLVTVRAEGLLQGRDQYHVVLGGYDVFALDDADMFEALHIEVGDVRVDQAEGTLSFPVTFAIQADCDAYECDGTWNVGDKAVQDLHYGAIVMWQVIGADDQLVATDIVVDEAYGWQADGPEIAREAMAIQGSVTGDRRDAPGTWAAAAIGTKSIHMALDHESHLVELATGISDFTYDPTTGGTDYTADLFFKQWNAETAEKPTSVITPGEVQTAATFTLLKFRSADARPVRADGSVRWEADGRPATEECAVDRVNVAL